MVTTDLIRPRDHCRLLKWLHKTGFLLCSIIASAVLHLNVSAIPADLDGKAASLSAVGPNYVTSVPIMNRNRMSETQLIQLTHSHSATVSSAKLLTALVDWVQNTMFLTYCWIKPRPALEQTGLPSAARSPVCTFFGNQNQYTKPCIITRCNMSFPLTIATHTHTHISTYLLQQFSWSVSAQSCYRDGTQFPLVQRRLQWQKAENLRGPNVLIIANKQRRGETSRAWIRCLAARLCLTGLALQSAVGFYGLHGRLAILQITNCHRHPTPASFPFLFFGVGRRGVCEPIMLIINRNGGLRIHKTKAVLPNRFFAHYASCSACIHVCFITSEPRHLHQYVEHEYVDSAEVVYISL